MAWVAGVTDDPPGFPHAPPGVDVMEGGKFTSYSVPGISHYPLLYVFAIGIVTRCPLELRLKKVEDGASWKAVLSYSDTKIEFVDSSSLENRVHEG